MRNVSTWPSSCTAAFQSWTGSCPAVVTDVLVRGKSTTARSGPAELLVGWDNVPMHRWAQSQMFRSLCFLLSQNLKKPKDRIASDSLQPLESKRYERRDLVCAAFADNITSETWSLFGVGTSRR